MSFGAKNSQKKAALCALSTLDGGQYAPSKAWVAVFLFLHHQSW